VVPFRVERPEELYRGRFVSRITGISLPLEYHLVMVYAEGKADRDSDGEGTASST
jgi:hypothetical protein